MKYWFDIFLVELLSMQLQMDNACITETFLSELHVLMYSLCIALKTDIGSIKFVCILTKGLQSQRYDSVYTKLWIKINHAEVYIDTSEFDWNVTLFECNLKIENVSCWRGSESKKKLIYTNEFFIRKYFVVFMFYRLFYLI